MPEILLIDTEPEPEPEVIVEEEPAADAVDAVEIAVEIELVERVTRLEDAAALTAIALEELANTVAGMQVVDEIQQGEIEMVAQETVQAQEEAEEVEEVIESTPEPEPVAPEPEPEPEPKPDEKPATREHAFYRKWGRKR